MKRFIAFLLTVVLTATIAVGGTLAYLQDTDSAVNVMTLGNVSIAQHEYERVVNEDGTYKTDTIDDRTSYVLQDFTPGKPLLPIVGDPNEPGGSDAYAGWDSIPVRMSQKNSYGGMKVFAGKNAQDKFVTVENTGKTDAYVRTIIAIEIGSTDGALIGQSYQDSAWTRTAVGNIVIDGNTYRVFEYNYPGALLSDGTYRHENGVLPAGDTTYPNLAQVYLKHNATNEDMEAIDGNNNGTLDILVVSQAVQAAGFDNATTALNTAFGKSTEKAAEWFGGMNVPTAVSSADALISALEGGKEVILANDINMGTQSISITDDIVINLNGNDIIADHGEAAMTDRASAAVLYIDGVDVVIEGKGDIKNTAEDAVYSVLVDNGAKVTIKDGNYITYHDAVYVRDGELIIEGGFFQATADTNPNADYVHSDYPNAPASHTAIVINCNKDAYINAKEGTTYSGGITAKVTITGGTFVNEDPSNIFEGWYINESYVPEGYKVISETQANGDIWYTVVAE